MNGMRARTLVASGILALVVGACGGSSATTAPEASAASGASTGAGAATPAPAATTGGGSSVAPAGNDPIGALANLASYKIRFSMGGSGITTGFAAMGNITMAGTIMVKPEPAADITMTIGGAAPGSSASAVAGITIHTIEKGGRTWSDATGTMAEQTAPGATSMVDSLSPQKLLGGMGAYLSQMKSVGDEQKNGIATTHYQADAALLSSANVALSMFGLKNGKWAWDVWVAKDGGYAVSYVMAGTGDAGVSMSISLDLSDVNSSSNTVTTP